ncbi:MAG: YdjY domain-containing protein [Planctomycetota bacterium]|nr:YdjY domain-containing protein [Planctomycetota bacterium]
MDQKRLKLMKHRMTLAFVVLGLATSVRAQESQPSDQTQTSPRVVRPFPGILVKPDEQIVEIEATVCLDAGWLEQIACAPASREHESLVVISSKPSEVHAALLLAGYESGHPGRWIYEDDKVRTEPPKGDAVNILVRYPDEHGTPREKPIGFWIRDHNGAHEFPEMPWIFGGSGFKTYPEGLGEGEFYIADMSGSIIGLVTFGDEVLGFGEVLSDQVSIRAPEWEVNTDVIPAMGTKVTIVIRPVSVVDEKATTSPVKSSGE